MSPVKRTYTSAMADEADGKEQKFQAFSGRLDGSLLQALDSMGYEYASPVQSKVLTDLRNLNDDCLVQAKTGTGKTIAFLLPALQSLLTSPTPVRKGQVAILILSPTRELASQIAKECDHITVKLPRKIECHTAFGGTVRASSLNKFMTGSPTVLVATPGRLKDILSEEKVRAKFEDLRTLVLDEADTMLEQGFLQDVQQLLAMLPPKDKGWQGMCFSATVPPKIKDVLHYVLKKGYTHITTVSAQETLTVDRVPQYYIVIPGVKDTFTALFGVLKDEYARSPSEFKCLVFTTTANGTALLHALFSHCFPKLRTWQIQSRMSQPARTRTTEEFKEATTGILFASDVVGRGMDFPDISLVVQSGLASSGDQYVHRIGRTARAGKSGRAIIILTQSESFFIKTNPQLPITPYPASFSPASADVALITQTLQQKVDDDMKRKAYQAWLGYHKALMKKLQLDAVGLVRMANEYAAAMGCPEPPMIERKVVGKMGLKGVPGLRLGSVKNGR